MGWWEPNLLYELGLKNFKLKNRSFIIHITHKKETTYFNKFEVLKQIMA
jgi:hypothetical protein